MSQQRPILCPATRQDRGSASRPESKEAEQRYYAMLEQAAMAA